MSLAGRVGLPVPAVFIRKQLDTLLVVERYDRKGIRTAISCGSIRRIFARPSALRIIPSRI